MESQRNYIFCPAFGDRFARPLLLNIMLTPPAKSQCVWVALLVVSSLFGGQQSRTVVKEDFCRKSLSLGRTLILRNWLCHFLGCGHSDYRTIGLADKRTAELTDNRTTRSVLWMSVRLAAGLIGLHFSCGFHGSPFQARRSSTRTSSPSRMWIGTRAASTYARPTIAWASPLPARSCSMSCVSMPPTTIFKHWKKKKPSTI